MKLPDEVFIEATLRLADQLGMRAEAATFNQWKFMSPLFFLDQQKFPGGKAARQRGVTAGHLRFSSPSAFRGGFYNRL